jgi:UDP-glucose 4-epimerase
MPYPASKINAEKALRESGLNWRVLRLAFVYGDADGHLQSVPPLFGNWNWHPAQRLSLVHRHSTLSSPHRSAPSQARPLHQVT